jgi:hypothetical protein
MLTVRVFRGRAYSGRMLDVGGGIGLLNLITGAGPIIYIISVYNTLPTVTISLTFSGRHPEHSAQLYFQKIKQCFSINFIYFATFKFKKLIYKFIFERS